MMLPPNAGRVISRALSGVALPIAASLSSSSCVLAILRPVVSATRPVFTRDATRGATSRPMEEAPNSMISGSNALITSQTAFV